MPEVDDSKTEAAARRKSRNVTYGLFVFLLAAGVAASFGPAIKTAIRSVPAPQAPPQAIDQSSLEAGDSQSEQSNKNQSQAEKQTTLVIALYAFGLVLGIVLLVLLARIFKFHPASWRIIFSHYKPHPQ